VPKELTALPQFSYAISSILEDGHSQDFLLDCKVSAGI